MACPECGADSEEDSQQEDHRGECSRLQTCAQFSDEIATQDAHPENDWLDGVFTLEKYAKHLAGYHPGKRSN